MFKLVFSHEATHTCSVRLYACARICIHSMGGTPNTGMVAWVGRQYGMGGNMHIIDIKIQQNTHIYGGGR